MLVGNAASILYGYNCLDHPPVQSSETIGVIATNTPQAKHVCASLAFDPK